jgi:hypothetical protein
MKKFKNGNGNHGQIGNISNVVEHEATEDEKMSIRTFDSKVAMHYIELGRLEAQSLVIDAKKRELFSLIKDAEKSVFGKITEVAKAHGINTDDPKSGKWNFDPGTMKFTKLNAV